MYNTGNPVPSAALEDMADNAQTFDALVTQTEGTTTDRLGRTRRVFQQILMDMGFQPLAGSFQTGATITARNQTLYDEVSHIFYAWGGVIPVGGYVVPVGSTPATSGGIGAGAWVDRTQETLRGEILPDIKDSKSLLSFGASGSGVASDQTFYDQAISEESSEIVLNAGKKFLITSDDNILGKPLTGAGHLVKAATGGLEAQNTYADHYQRVTGQEYLAVWYRKLYDQLSSLTTSPKIVFSGDSTTAGVGVDTNHQIQNLVQRGLYVKGCNTISGIDVVNSGHSGAPTDFWDGTYVAQDIAQSPDLYIVRWGINDPGWLSSGVAAPLDAGQSYPGRRTIQDFAYNLRSGLSKYRTSIPFTSGSILLMMPNSTYDIPNARDALWYEQLRDVYVQAARDFKCAFIDTYAIMQDSSQLANILMDDPMATSGRGIHPNNVMNCLIADHIVNLIAPEGLKYSNDFPSNSVLSVGGGDLLPGADLVPSSYNAALYFTRCIIPNGWPIDGSAITFRSADKTLLQLHYGYRNADRGKLMVRFGRADDLGGEGEGWSAWSTVSMGVFSASQVIPEIGFTLPTAGAMRISAEGGMRCIDGYIEKTTPSVILANTKIASINGAYAPGLGSAYGTATIFNGSEFEQVPVGISESGIYISKTTNQLAQSIYINISYNGNP